MIYQITLDDNLTPTADALSKVAQLTVEDYLSGYLAAFLTGEYKANLITKVKDQPINKLALINTAIDAAIV